MNKQLQRTMQALKANPAFAVELYEFLFSSHFWALVTHPGENVDDPYFLIYESADGVRELPVFTAPDQPLVGRFATLNPSPTSVEFDGRALWPRLLKVLEHSNAQVAVDPGEAHGIRLTRTMILGMISKYGGAADGP
jgi:SseB protein N-terminal domain